MWLLGFLTTMLVLWTGRVFDLISQWYSSQRLRQDTEGYVELS